MCVCVCGGGGGGVGGPLARFKHGKNSESLITDINFLNHENKHVMLYSLLSHARKSV